MLFPLLLLAGIYYILTNDESGSGGTVAPVTGNITGNVNGSSGVDLHNENELARINPTLANKVRQILALAKADGHIFYVKEGLRSAELQDKYYAQGRTTAGGIITYATSKTGKHVIGKAVDLAPIINGNICNSTNCFNWQILGNYVKRVGGLGWGGNWKNFKDYFHIEIA